MSLLPGTKVQCRWSGKTGRVLPPDRIVTERRHGVLVRLDPFLPRWGNETPREISGIEVIYHRRDLAVLTEESQQ